MRLTVLQPDMTAAKTLPVNGDSRVSECSVSAEDDDELMLIVLRCQLTY